MEFEQFKKIFNNIIFERSKADLLEKISEYPNRYIGIFRATKPKAKILQNLLQSHEIRFGDAFELLIQEYLKLNGFTILPKKFSNQNGEVLSIDQCFQKDDKIYFVEQKVRDDHDSTKKRGQIQNFEKKLNLMLEKYSENQIVGIVYFIDPELVKNRKFYTEELHKMSKDYNVQTKIFYGQELFNFLNLPETWNEIMDYLVQWKKEIPDLPEMNFDTNAHQTFQEIKDLKPLVFRKILQDDEIFNEIILTLFPQKATLKLLFNYFTQKPETIFQTLTLLLKKRLE